MYVPQGSLPTISPDPVYYQFKTRIAVGAGIHSDYTLSSTSGSLLFNGGDGRSGWDSGVTSSPSSSVTTLSPSSPSSSNHSRNHNGNDNNNDDGTLGGIPAWSVFMIVGVCLVLITALVVIAKAALARFNPLNANQQIDEQPRNGEDGGQQGRQQQQRFRQRQQDQQDEELQTTRRLRINDNTTNEREINQYEVPLLLQQGNSVNDDDVVYRSDIINNNNNNNNISSRNGSFTRPTREIGRSVRGSAGVALVNRRRRAASMLNPNDDNDAGTFQQQLQPVAARTGQDIDDL